jgi:LysM domain-containing protein
MDEAARQQRNKERLAECFPAFRPRLQAVLKTLEAQNLKPRIQEAWRSIPDQLAAFNSGHSKLKFGLHNVTGARGEKEALAADVLDDTRPLAPGSRYLLALALAARGQGLETGILWGLPSVLAHGVEAALAARNIGASLKVGWDPTHVQVVGIAASEARAGARPTFKAGQTPAKPGGTAQPPTAGAGGDHIVKRGENLSTIAKMHGITLATLLVLNPQFRANPNLIHEGDRVRLS